MLTLNPQFPNPQIKHELRNFQPPNLAISKPNPNHLLFARLYNNYHKMSFTFYLVLERGGRTLAKGNKQ